MHNREKLLEKLHTGVNRNHCPPMIVSGHSGSGKTWILEQFSQRLGEHPHRVLQASPSESTWPLSGLVALLATSPLTLPPKVFELLSEPPSDDAARFQVALHVQRILVEQLQPRTVIMIDDLDLMDLDSQRVIGFLATKLQGAHIRFVGTIGSGPSPEPFANFSRFPLPALGTASMYQVAGLHLHRPIDESVLELAVNAAQGVPGMLVEHLETLSSRQLDGSGPLVLPHRSIQSPGTFLRLSQLRLSESQQGLLRIASLAPVMERQALEELAVHPLDVTELLVSGQLELHGPLVKIGNPLLRARIYQSLDTDERLQLHEQVHGLTTQPGLLAFHASHLPEQETSPRELVLAAIELAGQGLTQAAVEVTEWAMHFMSQEEDLPDLLLQLSIMLLRAKLPVVALRYTQLARHWASETELHLKVAALETEINLVRGSPLSVESLEMLVEAHQQDYPMHCSRILSSLVMGHCSELDLDAAQQTLQRAKALISPNTSGFAVKRYRQAEILLAGHLQDTAKVLAEYAALGSTAISGETDLLLALARALSAVGKHGKARDVTRRITSNPGVHHPMSVHLAHLHGIEFSIRAGDVPHALKAIENWDIKGSPSVMRPLPDLLCAWYWMIKDRADMVAKCITRLMSLTSEEITTVHEVRVNEFMGLFSLVRGRSEEAIPYFRRALETYGPVVTEQYVDTAANLIDALASAGLSEEAAQEFRAVQSLLATVKTRHAHQVMRRAQALALPGEVSLSRFISLVENWQADDSLLELARVRHCYGQRLKRFERPVQAKRQLSAARTVYQNMGAVCWVQRVNSELSTAPAPAAAAGTPRDLLSTEDLQIVSMVHEGQTNRDIAKALFVSVSAIEARLTRLFRKTGTRNRQQLAAKFNASLPASA